MSEAERPKVGVGVVIHDGAGNIIMGERAGSHGAGTTNFSPLFSLRFNTLCLFLVHQDSREDFVADLNQVPSNVQAAISSTASPLPRQPHESR